MGGGGAVLRFFMNEFASFVLCSLLVSYFFDLKIVPFLSFAAVQQPCASKA